MCARVQSAALQALTARLTSLPGHRVDKQIVLSALRATQGHSVPATHPRSPGASGFSFPSPSPAVSGVPCMEMTSSGRPLAMLGLTEPPGWPTLPISQRKKPQKKR